ncbi:MAG: beta-ketoacyl synthase N-terminal-like domain-containing protein, partial [Planctomycetota bacterium]|nr:beta-ketoacyl synthase N-terminal-like domain-containing protein [Planctomycetota bacterium]
MTSPRVVITGMGMITPLGNTPQQVWQSLRAGKSGIGRLTDMGINDFPFVAGGRAWDFSGEIDDFGPLEPGPKKAIRKGLKMMCREIQMGIAASQRAIADAGDIASYGPERIGVVFGVDHITTEPVEFAGSIRSCRDESGKFDFGRWGTHGLPQITPLWLLKYLPNMPASHVAIYNDFRGPSNSLTMREAAGNLAIGEALAVIQRGAADVMLVGATGTRLHLLRSLHIALQETVWTDREALPETWSRPFDLDRRGMVLAEGSAAIVLEKESSARARGATIWGEVRGAGSAMAGQGPSQSDLHQSLKISTLAALRRARLAPHDLGHIHAHGA